jgi:hypothetical protein
MELYHPASPDTNITAHAGRNSHTSSPGVTPDPQRLQREGTGQPRPIAGRIGPDDGLGQDQPGHEPGPGLRLSDPEPVGEPPSGCHFAFDPARCVAFDVEAFPNHWLVGFYSPDPEIGSLTLEDPRELERVLRSFEELGKILVGYNSRRYDIPMLRAILAGRDPYQASQDLINTDRFKLPPWVDSTPPVTVDHIDLAARLERGGYFPSLKAVAAKLGFPLLQDLPFAPGSELTDAQWQEVCKYNRNDLGITWGLLEYFTDKLRAMAALSEEVGFDVRSMSEPKAAEAILENAYYERRGTRSMRMPVPASVYYDPPGCIVPPRAPLAREWYERIVHQHLRVEQDKDGKVRIDAQKDKFPVGPLAVSVGQGGLHTEDEACVYYPDPERDLVAVDVASFYPSMIATFGFMPRSYGDAGQEIYKDLLQLRLRRKAAARQAQDPGERARHEAASTGYKLVLNSVYGKFKSPYSTLFDPQRQIDVSFTGQLLLINLIEELQAVDCPVISANTDGLFLRPRRGDDRWSTVIREWESRTGMALEVDPLRRLVVLAGNNYAYVTEGGKTVRKGAELNGSLAPDSTPNHLVVRDAVANALLSDIPPERTISECRDPVRFCGLVERGGKTKTLLFIDVTGAESEIPGRVVRWYRAKGRSNRIERDYGEGRRARIDGAESVGLANDLTDGRMPADLDYAWYIARARETIQSTPGYRHRAPELLQGHPDAIRVHELGLVPIPKHGKIQPAGSSYQYPYPTYLWDWARFDSVGVNTGPAAETLVLDVDDPVEFKRFVTHGESPLLASHWDDLAGCLVSSHGDVTPADVRRGEGRGKLIFHCRLPEDHPLAEVKPDRLRPDHGLEVFYSKGLPTILGRHPDGQEYRVDGELTEPPAWLIELITPRVGTRPRKPPRRAAGPAPDPSSFQELVRELTDLDPALNPAAVAFSIKVIGGGYTILVGRCPFDHDSGTSTSSDLSAGFNQYAEPFLHCKHATCARAREINRQIKERFRLRQDTRPEAGSSTIELTPLARAMAASLERGRVSYHEAPVGAGKSYGVGQIAAYRYQLGLRTVVAVFSQAHADEVMEEIRKHAPEALERGAVCKAIGGHPGGEDRAEGDHTGFHYPIVAVTRIIITSHQQLGRRGFSPFLRGIWPLLGPDEEAGRPAYAILIDEASRFLAQLRIEIALDHRATWRANPQGGMIVPLNDCPKTARSGNCANCRLRGSGMELAFNHFGIREQRFPEIIKLEPGTGQELARPQLVLDVPAASFQWDAEVRIGDTLVAARVNGYGDQPLDPKRRLTATMYWWRGEETPHETPDVSLMHMLSYAFRPVMTWEYPYDHQGNPIDPQALAERREADDKDWARGVTFPLRTCQVPRLHFIDLMPLEQLRRFSAQNNAPILFTGAAPLPDDPDILREVFSEIEEVVHPYPNRRIKQVLLVFPEGRHGWGSLIGPDGKLITSSLEECGPQLLFTPTKDRAIDLYDTVRDKQETVELVVERDRVMDSRKPLRTDKLSKTIVSYSRGVVGIGSNRMLGLRCLVVDAAAFRHIASFTPEEISPEAFARLRAEERTALIIQNLGRGLRGEPGKTIALVVLNTDQELRDVIAAAPAIIQGSEEPPVTITGENLGVIIDQVKRWLDAGGGPAPEPDPSKAAKRAGRPARHPKPTPEDALAAAKSGVTYREYRRERHLDRLPPEKQREIKAVFDKHARKKPRKKRGAKPKNAA